MTRISILEKMGFSKTSFSETILTIDCTGETYSTPIGFKLVSDQLLLARIYKNTKLYELVNRNSRECKYCLCITSNPILFYKSVFERYKLKYRDISEKCIDKCDAYVIIDRVSIVDKREYSLVYFKPIKVSIVNKYPKTLRRVDYAILEALVYYTKIPYLNPGEREVLFEKIKWCSEVVYKSSLNRVYREIIRNIIDKAMKYLE